MSRIFDTSKSTRFQHPSARVRDLSPLHERPGCTDDSGTKKGPRVTEDQGGVNVPDNAVRPHPQVPIPGDASGSPTRAAQTAVEQAIDKAVWEIVRGLEYPHLDQNRDNCPACVADRKHVAHILTALLEKARQATPTDEKQPPASE